MRKTEQFGLNLWDLTDRIKMDDFNSDNSKIEAALAALSAAGGGGSSGGIEHLVLDYSPLPVLSGSFQIFPSISYPAPAWAKYSMYIIMGKAVPVEANGMALTSLETEGRVTIDGSSFMFKPGGFMYILLPQNEESTLAEGFFISSDICGYFKGYTKFRELNRLAFSFQSSTGSAIQGSFPTMRMLGFR